MTPRCNDLLHDSMAANPTRASAYIRTGHDHIDERRRQGNRVAKTNDEGEQANRRGDAYQTNPNDWTVKIASKYNRQYTGGGDEGLIDGIRGTTNFARGEWQGYQGQDFVATVDLQKETEVSKVGGGFLQSRRLVDLDADAYRV